MALKRLISERHWATSRAMTIARISELDRRTTQSGRANNGLWLLEFEREQALRPDPTSAGDDMIAGTRVIRG